MARLPHLTGEWGTLGLAVALMLLVGMLPPDTSLSEMRKSGVLKVCLPTSYPPLVTGDPAQPGIDVEILRALAEEMGLDLLISPNDAMGRDFNPGNWAITRANCQVLAGGVVDSTLTRSFLDTGPSYTQTGWSIVAPKPLNEIEGLTIGALTNISGLDRISLASFLRRRNVVVRIMPDRETLIAGINSGTLDAGVTETLLAGGIVTDSGWWSAPMRDGLARYNLVLGMWKGDLTLKREITDVMAQFDADGTLTAILARYGVGSQGVSPDL